MTQSKVNRAKRRRQAARKRTIFISSFFTIGVLVLSGAGGLLWWRHRQAQTRLQAAVHEHKSTDAEEPLHPHTPTPPTSTPVIPGPTSAKHDVTIPPVVNGIAPVVIRLATTQPIVFLGIDDGANKQPFELQMMKDNQVKASLFLADRFIHNNPGFFKDFVPAGSLIEDHSISHRLLSGVPYEAQKQEICGEADLQQQQFGRRPILFRPPGGSYDLNTQKAAAACGMKAVVNWIAKANGGSMQYQIGHSLRPGDIVLMHFRPEFKSDMQSFLGAEQAAGLHTELLEEWLPTQ